jgi:transcriptional regulator with XRE-family HTH domain
MDKKQTGLRIKTLRAAKRLSQQDLAEKLNIGRTTLSKIETGENFPAISILVDLKRIFLVSIDWILTGNGLRPIESDDSDVIELLNTIQESQIVKHAMLSYFYEYKLKNFHLFQKPGDLAT